MALTNEQIYRLYGSDARFPARFPELAELDIAVIDLPCRNQTQKRQTQKQKPQRSEGNDYVSVLEIFESHDVLVKRIVPLSEVRSVFLPNDVDPRNLSLDDGEWLVGPQVQDDRHAKSNLDAIKQIVAKNNPEGLGIAFVAESARVLNLVSIAESAEQSAFIDDRHTTFWGDPCC